MKSLITILTVGIMIFSPLTLLQAEDSVSKQTQDLLGQCMHREGAAELLYQGTGKTVVILAEAPIWAFITESGDGHQFISQGDRGMGISRIDRPLGSDLRPYVHFDCKKGQPGLPIDSTLDCYFHVTTDNVPSSIENHFVGHVKWGSYKSPSGGYVKPYQDSYTPCTYWDYLRSTRECDKIVVLETPTYGLALKLYEGREVLEGGWRSVKDENELGELRQQVEQEQAEIASFKQKMDPQWQGQESACKAAAATAADEIERARQNAAGTIHAQLQRLSDKIRLRTREAAISAQQDALKIPQQ